MGLSFAAYHVNRGGAYLFYPGGPPKPLPSLAPPVVVEKGHLFSRVTVMFDNVMHSIRIMNSPGMLKPFFNRFSDSIFFSKGTILRYCSQKTSIAESFIVKCEAT